MSQSTLPPNHEARVERAELALAGLAVGDALGETCFRPENYDALLEDPRATARGGLRRAGRRGPSGRLRARPGSRRGR